jgi:hypothetical protein
MDKYTMQEPYRHYGGLGSRTPDPEERRWVIVSLDSRYRPEYFVVPEVASGPEDPLAHVTLEKALELCAALTAEFGTPHVFFYLDHDRYLRFPSGKIVGRLP